MKMSQEDLASLKDAIRKQKGGGGTDDSTFVEASRPLCTSSHGTNVVIERQSKIPVLSSIRHAAPVLL